MMLAQPPRKKKLIRTKSCPRETQCGYFTVLYHANDGEGPDVWQVLVTAYPAYSYRVLENWWLRRFPSMQARVTPSECVSALYGVTYAQYT